MSSSNPKHDLEKASTTPGLPLSLGIGPLIEKADVERHPRAIDMRSLMICALCMGLAAVVAPVARLLMLLIGLITNLVFFGRVSGELVSPAGALDPLSAGVDDPLQAAIARLNGSSTAAHAHFRARIMCDNSFFVDVSVMAVHRSISRRSPPSGGRVDAAVRHASGVR